MSEWDTYTVTQRGKYVCIQLCSEVGVDVVSQVDMYNVMMHVHITKMWYQKRGGWDMHREAT